MPTTRTWIGGDDDNQASDPNNWVDPNGQPGAPQAGDTLIMNSGTMNVSDHDLEGDTLVVGSPSAGSIPPPVINLTNADVTQ